MIKLSTKPRARFVLFSTISVVLTVLIILIGLKSHRTDVASNQGKVSPSLSAKSAADAVPEIPSASAKAPPQSESIQSRSEGGPRLHHQTQGKGSAVPHVGLTGAKTSLAADQPNPLAKPSSDINGDGVEELVAENAEANDKDDKDDKSVQRPNPATFDVNRSSLAPAGSGQPTAGQSQITDAIRSGAGAEGRISGGQGDRLNSRPREGRLVRGREFNGDLRSLPLRRPVKRERPEREEPTPNPITLPGRSDATATSAQTPPVTENVITPSAPAPATVNNFDGLDFANWGAGHPPDTNGDVGPTYYIQTINTSVGIYRKSDTVRVAAFTFNTLMSQGHFGNLCDTNNFGDPVVLYDSFEDRWVITDFAFQLDNSGNVVNPPGAFQCFAVSKTGDPVGGGWNFYSTLIVGGLGDYPKLAIWPDGIYMSANVFGYPAGAPFQNPRAFAFNKAQMYAGEPTVQVVTFDAPSADFTILPSNARLQTGTPAPGTPNYFLSTWEFTNALTVYKFHVDWNRISLSTFTGPDTPLAATSWPNAAVANAPSQGGNQLDVLQIRAMVQNQYTKINGVESLWATHTVRRANTAGFAAPRYYQVDVTGGVVAANLPQAATFDPDGANVINRFMPSVEVDRAGNLALGYSTSSSTTEPAIKYAGRLATDPINTLSQSEQLLFQGTGTQTGNCGGSACIRWGDYSAMTLDPDGCTFWYTNMYYAVNGLNFQTRVGSFSFPQCTPVGGGGTLQGTVTASGSGNPIIGALVALGSRTTTTDGSGNYSFLGLPAGTYPTITASFPGFSSSTFSSIVVTDGGTTTQNFSLTAAPLSACLTDTTLADFQAGVATNCDLTSSPGDVTLLNAPTVDQQNTAGTTTGTSFGTTSWGGQTFIPAVTGTLVRADIELFCSGCTGTTPNLTLSVRATSGGLPTGADLATATIPGFSNGAGVYYTATFSSPATLTSGTQYALILRPNAGPSVGGYFWIRSSPSTYANGQRVISTDNGATWTADSTRDFNFKAFMQTGFAASGNLVSSLKDANPLASSIPNWNTISWTADTPAGTSVQFQAAGSNSVDGPFNFVGPDGTAGTFFGNGDSLVRFNGSRYLKYKAILGTTSNVLTPTLHDVTVCFTNVGPTTLTVAPASGSFGGTANLSATLTADGAGLSGKTVTFTLNGNSAGSGTTDGSGTATVSNASLAGINVGSYPGGVAANFAGDAGAAAASGSSSLTVSQASTQTGVLSSGSPSLFGQSVTFTATVTSTGGTPAGTVTFFDGTPQLGAAVSLNGSGQAMLTTSSLSGGSHMITATYNGDTNFTGSMSLPTTQVVVLPPSISKAFGVSSIANGGSTSLTFTLTNPTANTVALTGVGFIDTLPSGLVVSTPNGLTGSSGNGAITAGSGASTITLSGAILPVNGGITFSVNVTAIANGQQVNTTGAISSTNGGTGNTATATIFVGHATPTTTSISPTSATMGNAGFVLTVNGTNFDSSSVVNWNGSPRTTTLVSATQVTAVITSTDIASIIPVSITVVNAAPGGASNGQTFTINPVACSPLLPTATHLYRAELSGLDSIGSQDGFFDPSSYTNGKVGKAFNFNGNNTVVKLPNNFIPYPTTGNTGATPISFEAWFKTSSGGVIFGQQDSAVNFNGHPNSGWVPAVYVGHDGYLYASLFNDGSGKLSPLVSSATVNDGVFHRVAVTYDGGVEVLYLDGLEVGRRKLLQVGYGKIYSYEIGTGFTGFGTKGNWPGTSGGWFTFNGQVDEVAIYNQALTSDQVLANYNGGSAGQCFQSPTITSLTPLQAVVGSQPPLVFINGTGFYSGSTVLVNGTLHPANYSTSTLMSIQLTASEVSTVRALTITVVNPSPGGGTSNPVSFQVVSSPR